MTGTRCGDSFGNEWFQGHEFRCVLAANHLGQHLYRDEDEARGIVDDPTGNRYVDDADPTWENTP
jgi:hypothetical protein